MDKEQEELEEENEEEIEEEEMDMETRVDLYLQKNKGKLDKKFVTLLRPKLLKLDDATMYEVEYYPLKSPLKMFFISFFFGLFGIDRFLMGDTGMGVIKLFTFGGATILWIYDMFKLPKRIKEENVAGIDLDILDKKKKGN